MRVVGDVHHELTCGGTKQLGDDVRQHEAPVEQAVHSLGDGHGRVDVRAGDGTEHEHRDHHAEAVAHGDVQPAAWWPLVFFSSTFATAPLPKIIRMAVPKNSAASLTKVEYSTAVSSIASSQ